MSGVHYNSANTSHDCIKNTTSPSAPLSLAFPECQGHVNDVINNLTSVDLNDELSLLWLKIVSVCLLILMTLVGNMLVVVAICSSQNLRSSVTNLFVGKYNLLF